MGRLRELTSEKPPGLEQREESEHERKRERKAQEERENGVEAQEEQKKEVSAQGEQESHTRDGKAQGGRREEREVEAQEGHDGEEEMATQEKCVEVKKEANSMQENHVSNRHMTWWRDAWWVRMNGPHLRTARGRRRVWRAATRAARETRETERVAG